MSRPNDETYIEKLAPKARNEDVPGDKRYIIRIDREDYQVKAQELTGREILELAEKLPPEQYQLVLKQSEGNVVPVGLDESVDFRSPGVERFMTMKLDQTEG